MQMQIVSPPQNHAQYREGLPNLSNHDTTKPMSQQECNLWATLGLNHGQVILSKPKTPEKEIAIINIILLLQRADGTGSSPY